MCGLEFVCFWVMDDIEGYDDGEGDMIEYEMILVE